MHTKLLLKLLLALLVTANAAGCATRDLRDAAWDPRPGTALFEQIPNWSSPPCQKFCPPGG